MNEKQENTIRLKNKGEWVTAEFWSERQAL